MMNSKYLCETALLLLVRGILYPFPLQVSSWIMGKIWRLMAPWTKRHKRAQIHLENAFPSLSPQERNVILQKMWEHLGRTGVETLFLSRLTRQASRFVTKIEPVSTVLADSGQRGCVIVSLHTGNWEIAILPALLLGLNPAGVYQKLKNPFVEQWLYKWRRPLYPGGLYPKERRTALRLARHLKQGAKTPPKTGGAVALMGDLRERNGVDVTFFGQPATATPFPVFLARSCNVPLIAGRSIRRKGLSFQIEAEVVDIPHTANLKDDIRQGTQQLHTIFENWIREYPEQWMWSHRKWKR